MSDTDMASVSIESMRQFLMKKYPSGMMRGKAISAMPESQVLAIYTNVMCYKPKNKQIKGQMSLFD